RRVVRQRLADFGQRDPRGRLDREAVCTRADRRESKRSQAVLLRQRKTTAVAAGQQSVLAGIPAVPNGADRVNNVARRQEVSGSDFCIAGFAAVKFMALLE